MLITPSIYDPFTNNISFVELNKKRRNQKDHIDSTFLRIFIRQDGDFYSTPKEFEWRIVDCNQLDDLLKEAGERLKMKISPQLIYGEHGQVIKDLGQLASGQTYVFKTAHNRFPRQKTPKNSTQLIRTKSDEYSPIGGNVAATSNLANCARYYSGVGSISNWTHKTEETFSPNCNWISPVYEDTQLGHNIHGSANRNSRLVEENEVKEIRLKEHERMHRTNPIADIIYTFLNGQGIKCKHIKFARKQLEKGMSYVVELVAQLWTVKPRILVNMDGKKVRRTTDIMSRGAYVIVPSGQNFRETWYFLPDHAIDTSGEAAKLAVTDDHARKDEHKATCYYLVMATSTFGRARDHLFYAEFFMLRVQTSSSPHGSDRVL